MDSHANRSGEIIVAELLTGASKPATDGRVIIVGTSPQRPKSICFNMIVDAVAEQSQEMVLDTQK